jgi:predicted RecA/RadA family phage recombinase
MSHDAVFQYGPQRNLDHTPAGAVDPGELVKVADDGSDNVLWGVVNSALEANELGAADIIGIYRLNKEDDNGPVFAPAEIVAWDDAANKAVAQYSPSSWDIGVCLAAALATDDNVLVMLLGTVVAWNP